MPLQDILNILHWKGWVKEGCLPVGGPSLMNFPLFMTSNFVDFRNTPQCAWAWVIPIYSFTSHDAILTSYQHCKVCFCALICFNEQDSPVKINFLLNVTVCSPIGRYQHFGGTKCFCLQGGKFLLTFGVNVPDYFVPHSGRQQSRVPTVRNPNSHRFPVIILNVGLYVMNCFCNMIIIFNTGWRGADWHISNGHR